MKEKANLNVRLGYFKHPTSRLVHSIITRAGICNVASRSCYVCDAIRANCRGFKQEKIIPGCYRSQLMQYSNNVAYLSSTSGCLLLCTIQSKPQAPTPGHKWGLVLIACKKRQMPHHARQEIAENAPTPGASEDAPDEFVVV